MAMKRLFGDDYEGPSDGSRIPVADNKRRRLRLSFVVSEVMRMKSMEGFLSALEPLLRRVVKEEVDSVLGRFVQGVPRNSLPETLFTGSRIEAEGSEPFQIVIVDADSKMVVTSGPFSVVKIEILVLDGDFGSDGRDDWTEKEFDDSVVREREGKRPLLMGDLTIKLQDGTANVGDLAFTDNSSWRRSRRFRLGAKVVNDNNTKERIQEARSEPFIVKDHRGELYKKHYPPSWEDEVWRLEKIAKDGVFHRKLMRCAIKNVQDFLRFLVVDPTSLRNVLGVGMSNKTWEVACQHAKTCIIDRRCYSYYNLEWQVRLLFNSVYELVGVAFDGQDPQPLSNLTSYQKNLVEKLREAAYKNPNELTETIELPPPQPSPLLKMARSKTAVTHDDISIRNRATGKLGSSFIIFSLACGLFSFILCLAAEATRSEVTQVQSGEPYGCVYSGSGRTPLACAVGAFITLAIAMLTEHACMLVAISKPMPDAMSSTYGTLTWHACLCFLATWVCFAIAEVLLMIGIGVESGHLSDWREERRSCLVFQQGLFSAAGVFGLTTVFLAAALYWTALQDLMVCEEENDYRHQVAQEISSSLYVSPPLYRMHTSLPRYPRLMQENTNQSLRESPPSSPEKTSTSDVIVS
ncbi:hypothetical protein QJS10_CPA16g01610 [Acorus calamus]|uniref:Uncharacterized protein n=1 Tax=Acorus calamus TaxID=4465 RepID=A0AAV9CYJ7_ACOCL|nr:hypothetical protein QJS10_CPA16g01610 [Acorus calamus]